MKLPVQNVARLFFFAGIERGLDLGGGSFVLARFLRVELAGFEEREKAPGDTGHLREVAAFVRAFAFPLETSVREFDQMLAAVLGQKIVFLVAAVFSPVERIVPDVLGEPEAGGERLFDAKIDAGFLLLFPRGPGGNAIDVELALGVVIIVDDDAKPARPLGRMIKGNGAER